MSFEQGYLMRSTPVFEVETSSQPSRPAQRRFQSNTDLKSHIDNMLDHKKTIKAINYARSQIMSIYGPLAILILAITFFLSQKEDINEEKCKGKPYDWSYYGFVYYNLLAIYELVRTALNYFWRGGIDSITENENYKSLSPFLEGILLAINIYVNVQILFAFFQKESCPVLEKYFVMWSIVQIVPTLSLVFSLGLALFTLCHYLYNQQKMD